MAQRAAPSPAVREPGQVWFESYILERRLGRGGVGEVWLARQTGEVAGLVALKFVFVHLDPGAVEALRKEIEHARRLNHPGIVRIFSHHHRGGEQAIAMEYVDGRNLAAMAADEENGFFDAERLAPWVRTLADALDYAHLQQNVIHLDIKPSNLLVEHSGLVRLVDFGVACEFNPANAGRCYRGGTHAYMSPQQRRGENPHPTDDVFSLGVTLYELLTRSLPFGTEGIGPNPDGKPPPPPSDVRLRHRRPPLPKGWDDAILACLDPDPTARPATAGQLATWLDHGVRPRKEDAAPSPLVAALAIGLGLALTAAAAVWVLGAPATPQQLRGSSPAERVYMDDFRSGLDGWQTWGETPPVQVPSLRGRADVVGSPAPGGMPSGLTSRREFSAPDGFRLKADLLVLGLHPRGQVVQGSFGITADGSQLPGPNGLGGDVGDGIRFGVRLDGAASRAAPHSLRLRAAYQASFLSESGTVESFTASTHGDAAAADGVIGRWVPAEILVGADRSVQFRIEGRTIWSPNARLHPAVLVRQRLVLATQAVDAPGSVHFDNLAWNQGGQPVVQTLPASDASSLRVDLPWGVDNWEIAGADAARVWADLHPALGLNLVSASSPSVQVLSRRAWRSTVAAEFLVQPAVGREGDLQRYTRVGLRGAPAGSPAFIGVEFRDGRAWALDGSGGASQPTLFGTCPPGQWHNVVVEVGADGVALVRINSASPGVASSAVTPGAAWRACVETGGGGAWIQTPSVGGAARVGTRD